MCKSSVNIGVDKHIVNIDIVGFTHSTVCRHYVDFLLPMNIASIARDSNNSGVYIHKIKRGIARITRKNISPDVCKLRNMYKIAFGNVSVKCLKMSFCIYR